MAQKTLDAVIRLMGKEMPSFTKIGTSIESLGNTIDQIGSRIREFEEESVQVYRTYEDHMLGVRGALEDDYDSVTIFAREMESLEEYASKWAKTSIFHTNDVAEAMEEAVHAGWHYKEIIEGIPQAMLIAQAGGMTLSEALDYLVTAMNTTHTEFDDMDTVIDQWSKAANSSATTIDEMGQAFTSLSASASLGDSTQELYTFLAVMANAGIKGSQAGTQLRNAMLRVVAPTQKAMDAMEELELSEEGFAVWAEMWENNDISKQLEEIGFSAYDAEGNLKPMVTIFSDLNRALDQFTPERRNEIIKTIFPTRTFSAANSIFNAMQDGSFWEIYDLVGDSEGYAQRLSDIMMSGLTGSIELLLSKWEDFQNTVGEVLAPWIEQAAEMLGNIVDWLNGLDEVQMNALVGAMTALAATGPALMTVGGAIKLIGTLGPAGLTMILLAAGAGALAGGLSKLN